MRARCAAALLTALLATPFLCANTSNSLLDISRDGGLVLATNPDNGTVSVIDVANRKKLHEVRVGAKPESVTWIGTGPLAAVSVYHEDKVIIFDALEGKVVHSLAVDDEPYGIVASKDGLKAWVTHEYPGTISEIDLKARKVVRTLPGGAFLRGVCLSPDEKSLYVSEFYTAKIHKMDLASGKCVDTWEGHSTDNLARHVVVHPTLPRAYLSHIRSRITVVDGSGSIFPALTVATLTPPDGSKRRTGIMMDSYNGSFGNVVCNPWESDISPDGKRLYTIYAATDDANVHRVLEDGYREVERIAQVRVGRNPRAIRVSPDGKSVLVYNAMDFTVTIHDENLRRQGSVVACDPPKTPEWVLGKTLFNSARPPLTSRQWIACSSCHPDGHTDGRVWQNPEGLRKTPAMAGMAHTHPLHWSADRDEVQDFEYTIQGRLMQGSGYLRGKIRPKRGFESTELDETTGGRSKELDAIAVYSNAFDFTLSPHIPAPGKLSPSAQHGKELFFSKGVGCATCHSGPYYTDSQLKKPFHLHDVGTGSEDRSEKIGPKYDTPTLLGVYRTAPYLHHGKAKTLHEVLTSCNVGDKHGKTSHLSKSDIEDLVAFLKSLPYEMPPEETPNSVKFRLIPTKKE